MEFLTNISKFEIQHCGNNDVYSTQFVALRYVVLLKATTFR